MGGSHVAVTHTISGVEDVDTLTLGRCGVRSAQHVGRHGGAEPCCVCGLLDEIVGAEARDALTGPSGLGRSEQRAGRSGRTLQRRNGGAGADVECDRLWTPMTIEHGADRSRRAVDLFMIEGQDLTETEPFDEEQSNEQCRAKIAGSGQEPGDLFFVE